MNTLKRFASARWNPALRRMEPTEEAEDGTILAIGERPRTQNQSASFVETDDKGNAVVVVCSDRTRRPADRTGLEAASHQSHREAKVPLVPVTVPKQPTPRKDAFAENPERELSRVEGIARKRVEAIMGGMTENMSEWIGYEVAGKRYGFRDRDECQKTMAGRLAAASER